MPEFDEAASTLRARFDAQWTETEKAWQNAQYKASPGVSFVFFEIVGGPGEPASIGNGPGGNLHRSVGLIQAHVFTPVGEGDGQALEYARQIGQIFRDRVIDSVVCGGASIGGGETPDDDGNWWRRTVSVPFRTDA